jgi:hypothetical protein
LDFAMFVLKQKKFVIIVMIFFNHYRSLHPCGGGPFDEDGSFHYVYQSNN